jgi:hypothetical protein
MTRSRYLDSERLKDGERWDDGFMHGLSHSWVVVSATTDVHRSFAW